MLHTSCKNRFKEDPKGRFIYLESGPKPATVEGKKEAVPNPDDPESAKAQAAIIADAKVKIAYYQDPKNPPPERLKSHVRDLTTATENYDKLKAEQVQREAALSLLQQSQVLLKEKAKATDSGSIISNMPRNPLATPDLKDTEAQVAEIKTALQQGKEEQKKAVAEVGEKLSSLTTERDKIATEDFHLMTMPIQELDAGVASHRDKIRGMAQDFITDNANNPDAQATVRAFRELLQRPNDQETAKNIREIYLSVLSQVKTWGGTPKSKPEASTDKVKAPPSAPKKVPPKTGPKGPKDIFTER